MRQQPDAAGTMWNYLDILCMDTKYNQCVLCLSKNPSEIAEQLETHWLSFAGPPDMLVHDLGGESQAAFTDALERWSSQASVGPTEAPWQQAMIERHGAVLDGVARAAIEKASATGQEEMRSIGFSSG